MNCFVRELDLVVLPLLLLIVLVIFTASWEFCLTCNICSSFPPTLLTVFLFFFAFVVVVVVVS